MESAKEFLAQWVSGIEKILIQHGVYSFDLQLDLLRHFDVLRGDDRTAIRKECADRAVEWVNQNLCDEHMPIMYKRLEENELRAAIEGRP